MKKNKDIIYIPGQDKWSEHFPTPGKLRPSNFGHMFCEPNSQFNKQLRTPKQIKIQTKMKKNQLLIDNLRTHILQSLENLEELLEQEDINLRTLRIKELEISFTVTRRTKSEYLKSLDFWYNPLTNYKEYQIPLQK